MSSLYMVAFLCGEFTVNNCTYLASSHVGYHPALAVTLARVFTCCGTYCAIL